MVADTCNKTKKWKERKLTRLSHYGAGIRRREMASSRGKIPLLAELCRQWQNLRNSVAEICRHSVAEIKVRPTYIKSAGEIKFSLSIEPVVALHLALQDRNSFGD